MKNPSVGLAVTHYGRQGFIEAVGDGLYVVVRFPSQSNFPFPSLSTVRISELKRFRPVKKVVDAEPAPF
jgi:hypothetical protein